MTHYSVLWIQFYNIWILYFPKNMGKNIGKNISENLIGKYSQKFQKNFQPRISNVPKKFSTRQFRNNYK